MRAIRRFRCRATSMRRSGATPPASNSATAQASTRCSPKSATAPSLDEAAPIVNGSMRAGAARVIHSPIDGKAIGRVSEGDDAVAAAAMAAAAAGFAGWAATPVDARAAVLERASDLLESARGRLIALLQAEGGKTLDDAVAEVREAVDFCRYYAVEARRALSTQPLPGPTGERNELRYRGRGVFVCISPWNFPLAIFLGQVAAALAAGNAVVAKPAEQTPLIAAEAVQHPAPGRRSDGRAATAARRRQGRRRARRRSSCRRRRLHRLDRGGACDQSHAGSEGWRRSCR